jgi:hypothetical protein
MTKKWQVFGLEMNNCSVLFSRHIKNPLVGKHHAFRTQSKETPMAKQAPLPPRLVYSLLKALDVEKLKKAEIREPRGQKPNKQDLDTVFSYLDAVAQAKSAKQFERKIKGNTEISLAFLITYINVEYTDEGYTIITIRLLAGGTLIFSFPTEDED